MDSEFAKTVQKVKRELADFLGIGMDDIEEDTFFTEDLHMNPTDMTDFIEILGKAGFDITNIDLSEIETFGELTEIIHDKYI